MCEPHEVRRRPGLRVRAGDAGHGSQGGREAGALRGGDGELEEPILYYTILYYAMLCYAMLCYAMLYYTILIIQYNTIRYDTILLEEPGGRQRGQLRLRRQGLHGSLELVGRVALLPHGEHGADEGFGPARGRQGGQPPREVPQDRARPGDQPQDLELLVGGGLRLPAVQHQEGGGGEAVRHLAAGGGAGDHHDLQGRLQGEFGHDALAHGGEGLVELGGARQLEHAGQARNLQPSLLSLILLLFLLALLLLLLVLLVLCRLETSSFDFSAASCRKTMSAPADCAASRVIGMHMLIHLSLSLYIYIYTYTYTYLSLYT